MGPTNDNHPSNLEASESRPANVRWLAAGSLNRAGTFVFAAMDNGEVLLCSEGQGGWGTWTRPAWDSGGPKSITRMAVSQITGGLQYYGLDDARDLWSTTLSWDNATWGPWEIPALTSAPPLRSVAGLQLNGPHVVWGIKTSDDSLISSHGPAKPGGPWVSWLPWPALGMPKEAHLIDITAAQQNNGCAALWALDNKFQLRCCYQTGDQGFWTNWSEPNWNGAPGLVRIAATRQGADRGAGLWGIQQNGRLIHTSQDMPSGKWSTWAEFGGRHNEGRTVSAVTATRQINGMVRVWVVEWQMLQVWTIAQTPPDGAWGDWEHWET